MPMWLSEGVDQRTYNTIVTAEWTKKRSMVYTIHNRKLTIQKHEPEIHWKSRAQDGKAVTTSLVTPVMLPILKTP